MYTLGYINSQHYGILIRYHHFTVVNILIHVVVVLSVVRVVLFPSCCVQLQFL